MNSDSFAVLQQNRAGIASRNTFTALTGLGTTETVLTMGADTGTVAASLQLPVGTEKLGASNPLNVGGNAALLGSQYGMDNKYLTRGAPYFNSDSFDGRPFLIQASGKINPSNLDSTTAHFIKLYTNTTPIVAGATSLISVVSSTTQPAGATNWMLQATCVWDATSSMLVGEAWGLFGGASASTATYTSRTSFNISSVSTLLFFLTVKFNNGAANTITPQEFCLSAI